ncbi:MAG: AraC family transcriptional regulator [Sphingomonas bacterium]
MGKALTRMNGEFSASDLVREAAARAMHIAIDMPAAVQVDAPMMRGTMIASEVQPGLEIACQDLVHLHGGSFGTEVDRSLLCALLVEGESEPMLLPGRPPIEHKVGEALLIGFGARTPCRRHYRAGQRKRAFALTIRPAFLERFEEDVSDAGLTEIRALIEPGGGAVVPQPAPVLAMLADDMLHQRYGGQLGRLYQESLVLRFVVEASARLRERGRLRHSLGRRGAGRISDARDILDASLIKPPKTLDLARMVGSNVTSLQAGFRQAFGTTIFGYVRTRRLEIARLLIGEQGLGVAEAGYKVGFTSAAAFTAAYRRHFGHAPTRQMRDR